MERNDKILSKSTILGVDLLILVLLGTQKQSFKRLLDYVENISYKEEIVVQRGYTKYESKKMKMFDFISYDELEEYVKVAHLIITHGGTGSIISSLQNNKKVIACARLKKYQEHVDDHQLELVSIFAKEGYILELNENNELDDLVKKITNFKPKKYITNTNNFLKKLICEIERGGKK